jgi:alpha-beta hydrolase superfamily lysophospholipase
MIFAAGGLMACIALIWLAGSYISSPCNQRVELPADLGCEPVQFRSDSGSLIRGSFIQGQDGKGAIILMHGIRGSRAAMAEHARFLSKVGFSVLLFDFQCHGESPGKTMTFGLLESKDAQAAVRFLRERLPNEKVGVLGCSLGGAAAVLSNPPLDVQAGVIEMVYSEIRTAVANRLAIRLGEWARIFTPLLTWQLHPRLGYAVEAFSPANAIKQMRCPKLIMGGSKDRHTTEAETRALFAAATEPKELWIVPGAAHEDLHRYTQEMYEERLTKFFRDHLSRGQVETSRVSD